MSESQSDRDQTLPRAAAVKHGEFLVAWCPYCGEQHVHSARAYGHRVAHCLDVVPGRMRMRGYYLFPAAAHDPLVLYAQADALLTRLLMWATLSNVNVHGCPRCQAQPGERCIQADGKHWNPHTERVLRLAQVANSGTHLVMALRKQLESGDAPDMIERAAAESWLSKLYVSLQPP